MLFHVTLPLGLIALTGGLALYIWGLRSQGIGTGLAKTFGLIVVVLSILQLVCMSYWGFRFWQYRHAPGSMPMQMMQQHSQPPQP